MRILRSCVLPVLGAALLLLGLTPPAAGQALRVQAEQRGDFLVFGNTAGFDCRTDKAVPDPVVGQVSRDAATCGTNLNDSAVDVFWRSDEPASGQVSLVKEAAKARSTAVLALPEGASVTYARIYWSGGVPKGATPGQGVLVERPGVFSQPIIADAANMVDSGPNGPGFIYQSSADITRLLQRQGPGAYRVSGISTVELLDKDLEVTELVWSVVVFYRRDADPPRNLALFDGLSVVSRDAVTGDETQANVTLSGFLVPQGGEVDAKLGVIAYEGDFDAEGDFLQFNGTKLSNALNPENNFFNATRSVLGQAITVPGDLPQMSGQPGSMNGYDLDIVDVHTLISAGDSSANLSARTAGDTYFLGAFVTAVGTFKPLFTDTRLSVVDLTAAGRFAPGDDLEYTLETRNTGNDDGTGVFVDIQLPPGVTYTPGSIRIESGEGAGQKTDAIGDDQAEYFPGTRVVRIRLGQGADGRSGGTYGTMNAPTVIKLNAKIDADARGRLTTQAVVSASGRSGDKLGIRPYRFYSTDTTATGGAPAGTTAGAPTEIDISECDGGGAQCAGRASGAACVADTIKVCGCQKDEECAAPATCDLLRAQCVLRQADLQVKVTTTPGDGKPQGLDPVTYRVQVSNLGPGPADGARIVVSLPPGSTVSNVMSSDWICAQDGDRLVCTRKAPIAAGQSAPDVTFSVTPGPTPGAVIAIEATSTAAGGAPAAVGNIVATDPDNGNNIVVLGLDGASVYRAAGGGFGCAVALPLSDDRGASAAALLTLGALLGLGAVLRRPARRPRQGAPGL